jgi:PAS domain S-box-containing protein
MSGSLIYILIILLVVLTAASVYFFVNYYKTNKKFDSLNRQINNYESIIDQANDAMLVIDIVDGRIHQSNPSAASMLGYSNKDLQKKTLFDLHPKEYLERSSYVVADVWEKGGLVYQDIPFVSASGKVIPVECSAKVAPFAGRPAIVIYARDIEERLKLEKEIRDKNSIIEDKNREILDSITYARRLQRGILPSEEILKDALGDYFVLYHPKDIVSGDFYWCIKTTTSNTNHKMSVVAAIDCTGHGVPGAFMSMVGYTLLNQTVKNPDINSPADVLNFLNTELPRTIKAQDKSSNIRDGMDMVLCAIDWESNKLHFAGANNPLWILRNKELIELKANKQAITASEDMIKTPFTGHSFDLQKGDIAYLFTDGYADQFGGPKGKKFMYKRFAEILIKNSELPMEIQKNELQKAFEDWKGMHEQVDDVLIIGIRI